MSNVPRRSKPCECKHSHPLEARRPPTAHPRSEKELAFEMCLALPVGIKDLARRCSLAGHLELQSCKQTRRHWHRSRLERRLESLQTPGSNRPILESALAAFCTAVSLLAAKTPRSNNATEESGRLRLHLEEMEECSVNIETPFLAHH